MPNKVVTFSEREAHRLNISVDELLHYGVLGMKWGVRKDRRGEKPVRRKIVDTTDYIYARSGMTRRLALKLDSDVDSMTKNVNALEERTNRLIEGSLEYDSVDRGYQRRLLLSDVSKMYKGVHDRYNNSLRATRHQEERARSTGYSDDARTWGVNSRAIIQTSYQDKLKALMRRLDGIEKKINDQDDRSLLTLRSKKIISENRMTSHLDPSSKKRYKTMIERHLEDLKAVDRSDQINIRELRGGDKRMSSYIKSKITSGGYEEYKKLLKEHNSRKKQIEELEKILKKISSEA